MASSTTALESGVDSETLREDLFYLLTTIKIDLPRLGDRREDLQPLAQFFLEERNRGEEKQVGGFSDEVWEQFQEYNWPGNLDELMAVVTEAWSTCSGGLVQAGDLPFRFRTGLDGQHIGPPIDADITPLASLLATVEAEEIRRALAVARQNKTRAAKLLGLTRARLYRRMQALDIADQEEEA